MKLTNPFTWNILYVEHMIKMSNNSIMQTQETLDEKVY